MRAIENLEEKFLLSASICRVCCVWKVECYLRQKYVFSGRVIFGRLNNLDTNLIFQPEQVYHANGLLRNFYFSKVDLFTYLHCVVASSPNSIFVFIFGEIQVVDSCTKQPPFFYACLFSYPLTPDPTHLGILYAFRKLDISSS